MPRLLFVFFLASISLVGCNRKDAIPEGLFPVSGKVTLDNEMLVNGNIAFVPVDSENAQSGDGRSGGITDGTYSFDGVKSLKPGEYLVRINAFREYDRKTKGEVTLQTEDQDIVKESLVPPKYNKKSTLRATVVAENPNIFDFDLEKK